MKTPILLLTGYLGSGKTTLLNRILTNERGIRFAVIVNDIGEVNIDAELIQKGGIVGQDDNSDLVALQNGCICCTLQNDLIKQISDLLVAKKFDYIVIEASGVCEPAPIAQTICSMEQMFSPETGFDTPRPRLDCIVTVVDALRMKSDFGCGNNLDPKKINEEDIENLIINQIEFCDLILLNKISEVSAEEAAHIKAIIRALQPKARIIDCDFCDVPLKDIIDTNLFDFDNVATSATWIQEIEKHTELDDPHAHHHEHEHEHGHHHNHCDHNHANFEHGHDHDDHCEHGHDHNDHCEHGSGCNCHHHHHHGEGEAEEYGIGTFVYFRRRPFNFEKFDRFVNLEWPGNVIRTKGVLYFSQNRDMSILFEQAGIQKSIKEAGYWYATAPDEELKILMAREPGLERDWDETYGDRMIKLVFIGRNLDRENLTARLDACLESQ